ncbi:MAG TPA: hypothetical protein VGE63_03345 [Candidatus Paceibacterota bacterium]
MKKFILGLVFVGITFLGAQHANAQVFNTYPGDCPTIGVTTLANASNGCRDSSIDGVNPGDILIVGVYFHNTSPIDTSAIVRMSDLQGGSGKSVPIYGTIQPADGAGAGGQGMVHFSQTSRLEYMYTKVYWNGRDFGGGGVETDRTGRVFTSGEPLYLVPGMCSNCADKFIDQGVVKAYYRVIGLDAAPIEEAPQWNTNGYPRVVCAGNNNGTVTVKAFGNGKQVQFKNYFNDNWVNESGNNEYTWYNVPNGTYNTAVRFAGSGNSRGGSFQVNCNVNNPNPDPDPGNPPSGNFENFKVKNNTTSDGIVIRYTSPSGDKTFGLSGSSAGDGSHISPCITGIKSSVVKISGVSWASFSIISCDGGPSNPNPDPEPQQGTPEWNTNGYPRVICNNNGTANVTIKAYGNGKQVQFKHYSNGSWVTETGNNEYTFYNVPSKSGVYTTGVRFVGSTNERQGFFAVSCNDQGPTNPEQAPDWNVNGYPRVVCNTNGTATVTVKAYGNGKQVQFRNYNNNNWVTETGNNEYTWYNVPSRSQAYATAVRFVGQTAERAGYFAVNCNDEGPTNPTNQCAISDANWDTAGYPRVEFLSATSNDVSVIVKAKNTGGKTVEFFNAATQRYEVANMSDNRIIWSNIIATWPIAGQNGNKKLYSTWLRFQGCTERVQGWFEVTPREVSDNTTKPSVETRSPEDVSRNSATIVGNLLSKGGLSTQTYLYWGRRQGSTCTASDLIYKTPETTNANTGTFSRYISGLSADTWYCYQAAASNNKGEVKGDIRSFKTTTDYTPSDVIRIETTSATNISSEYATLRGEVVDTGDANTVRTWFEFGNSSSTVSNGNGTRYSVSGDFYRGNSISRSVSGLQRGTRYYFRACGENTVGQQDCGDVLSFVTEGNNSTIQVDTEQESDVSYTAARMHGRVRETGRSTRLRTWFEYSTSENNVYNGNGSRIYLDNNYGYSQGQSFSQMVTGLQSNTRYFYRACGDNTEGERDCGDVESFVTLSNNYNPVQPERLGTLVTTLAASSVRQYNARLNGSFNARDCSSELWFEYGRTSSLGEVVNIGTRSAYDRGVVSADISGLKPNTTYYFRIVGSGCGSIVRGATKTFKTPKTTTTVVNPPVKQKPVVKVIQVKEDVNVAAESICSPDLDLKIDNNRDTIGNREEFDYVITYQNLTQTYVLRDIEMQVEIPPQLEFVSSSRGTYNKASHSLFISRMDLNPSQRETFTVTVRAKKGLVEGDLIVASATASFISPTTGINDSSTDFDSDEYLNSRNSNGSSDNSSDRSLFGSSDNGGNGFLPSSLVGWLSLIFLVFLFIAALRWLWFGKKGNEYNYAYGPYGVPPTNNVYGAPVQPVAPVAPVQPVQPIYVPFNPNQPR